MLREGQNDIAWVVFLLYGTDVLMFLPYIFYDIIVFHAFVSSDSAMETVVNY